MLRLAEPDPAVARTPLGRANPLTKLAVAAVWLVALVATLRPHVPLVLAAGALVAGVAAAGLPPGRLLRAVAPLWLVAAAVGVSNAVFAAANLDPAAHELARIGPLRLTEPGVAAGLALALRVAAIGATSVVFALTTGATALADALVQRARLPPRFAYAALAAYRALPRFALDLDGLRAARRLRGLPGHDPRLIVALLVLAIRHADRMGLAMDARGFDAGIPRTHYRLSPFGALDVAVLAVGTGLAVAALAAPI